MADKTWLFVPAKQKFLKNFDKIEADNIILDLEDSLLENQKEEGLVLESKIGKQYAKEKNIYVRINSDERMETELKRLCEFDFAGFMIPKFESIELVEKIQKYVNGKEIIALIETVKGVIELPKIAECLFVNGLAFGAEDFCKELGYEAGEESTYFARNQLVLYGSYFKKYTLDGVCLEIHNMEIFIEAYKKTKRMGFHGKLLIHPNQAQAVKEYTTELNIEKLKHIVNTFKNSNEGVLFIDGEFYEKPMIDKIERYLNEFVEFDI